MKKLSFLTFIFIAIASIVYSQNECYWQQEGDYKMEIDFDVSDHRFIGTQTITYTNNSPDVLDRLFYHLYFNAFQPGSMMDVRSRNIPDPDSRVGSRIAALKEHEIGYQKVKSLNLNGKKLKFKEVGTILEVDLADNTIQPGQKVMLYMEFEGQVPLQIRRSGRDNDEGISYSMAQWYPKLCEYDEDGWHANPYIGREFYGVWGDFDVQIAIDKTYMIGATGVLQNDKEIGMGYSDIVMPHTQDKLVWKFKAENVHDFVWAADPDYDHIVFDAHEGTKLHFIYQPNEKTTENWRNLPKVMDEALRYINAHYGKYPYPVYSFIQGGDGGMEYPMATLVTGERNFNSLVGVCVHEWMHSWYQMMLGTNEALYPWMDEGFTSYGSAQVMNHLRSKGLISGDVVDNPMSSSVIGYVNHALSPLDEPISTHADHYMTNRAYGIGSYTKGSIFLEQLRYIIGDDAFDKGLLDYYDKWKFKHPDVNDFVRVMENASGLELDWYKEYWVYTTRYPDYAIDTVIGDKVMLSQKGQMPMPLEVVVTTIKDKKEVYYIPLRMMRGEKTNVWGKDVDYNLMEDWPWTNPTYELEINCKIDKVKSIEINPTINFVDTNRKDNIWPRKVE